MSGGVCGDFPELVSALVDERLEGAELLRLQGHLAGCPSCREFEAGVRRVRALLVAGEALRPLRPPPAGFAAAVMARVPAGATPAGAGTVVPFPGPARPAVAPSPGRRIGPRIALAVAAAVAAVFFAIGWQRILPLRQDGLQAARPAGPAAVAAVEEGSMDDYLSRHTLLARGASPLGAAEEVELVAFSGAPAGR